MQQKSAKQYFSFRRGLNTLSNEITFPDEYTSDEMNYTIEADGSRRRRKALDREASGSTKTVATITAGQANQSFLWADAGAIENLWVHQFGSKLYFTDDAEIISTTYNANVLDLSVSTYKVDASTSATTIGAEPCSFAVHRGYLIVTHKYLRPIRIGYTGTAFDAVPMTLLVRDFEGIDDGVGMEAEPAGGGTIDPDHYYNLLNRGWKDADINSFENDKTKWPAKNAIWHLGYKRTDATAGVYLADGDRAWDSDKMDAEAFGKSSAPQGSLFINPLDTTTATGSTDISADKPLSFSSTQDPTSNSYATVTVTGHGYTSPGNDGDSITVSGHLWEYSNTLYGEGFYWSLDGTWTFTGTASTFGDVEVIDANTLRFWVGTIDTNFDFWELTDPDGQIDGGARVENSQGKVLSVGPTACTSFAGRIWYAGIPDPEWADTVFFSQVSLKPATFPLCHQKQDPTDEYFNQLKDDDGGTIIIPNLGRVTQMLATRNAVLIFSTNGVWEISGGRGGFSATSYSVRKITDIGCTSPYSPILVENSVIYTGPNGIIALTPNQYTGLLEDAKMSDVIEPTWNAIPATEQRRVQTAYDDAKNRVYFLYRDNAYDTGYTSLAHGYNFALVWDMKNQGWYRLHFDDTASKAIISMFAISEADSSESNQKIKFQCQQTTTTVDTCDMNQTDYVDFTGSESPLPYLVTGWDTSYGFQNRKQAPIVHVYNRRTTTAWVDAGGGDWSEVNPASTLMTPFWDWTDSVEWDDYDTPTTQQPWSAQAGNYGISGKIGKQVETARPLRSFTPLAAGNVDGYPVIATRHKVRGRGRSLSMRFDGQATKDSHLLGFTVNYSISRRV